MDTSQQDQSPLDNLTFEQALQRLEEIALGLEQGDLPLDDALRKYDEAIRLKDHLLQQLQAAEEKVKVALAGEAGEPRLADFDETEM